MEEEMYKGISILEQAPAPALSRTSALRIAIPVLSTSSSDSPSYFPLSPVRGSSSWKDVVDKDLYDRVTAMERKRQEVIHELIASEIAHVQDISQVVLGRDDLDCYVRYCAHQRQGSTRLTQLMERAPALREMLKKLHSDARCRNLRLTSFLLAPMQRLTRYALLLEQMIRYTGISHVDYEAGKEALSIMRWLLQRANEAARDQEERERVTEVTSLIRMDKLKHPRPDLTGETRHVGPRRYILEGAIVKRQGSGRKLYGFLFNDMLLMCEVLQTRMASDQSFLYRAYKEPIMLAEVGEMKSPRPTSLNAMGKKQEVSFTFQYGKDVYIIRLGSVEECRRWHQSIQECIEQCQQADRANLRGLTLKSEERREEEEEIKREQEPIWLVRLVIREARGLPQGSESTEVIGNGGYYCVASLNVRQTYKTALVPRSSRGPRWDQGYEFSLSSPQQVLTLSVFQYDRYSRDRCLGRCEVDLHFLTYSPSQRERVVDLTLHEDVGRFTLSQGKGQGMLRVRLGHEQLLKQDLIFFDTESRF
ncbi:Dbl homology domain-containing protein [Piptocephalis cylindrospora]|uniref:Dbl homology domain-containing protein n=1 Tax=Piptocephalis cylindrospora TaxID=1907219 RepID=A0A4P9Y790_9FUNG|nr:Dbl homology domain-containing protein [Piptocephalis cylindrospora]|eukprot:RKP14873.1 Dbl homology domain-containing protein [Piptocephalis cylindrospora]